MGTLTFGFAAAWAGLAGYVAWMAHQQRTLTRRVERLQQAADQESQRETPRAAADAFQVCGDDRDGRIAGARSRAA